VSPDAPEATPTLPVPTPAVPTSSAFSDAEYELDEERTIGSYAVRIWRNARSEAGAARVDRVLTIAQTGAEPILIEFFAELDPLSGRDINADGVPEVIVGTFTGGAHCCFSTIVYSLGATPTRLLETRASNCGGRFTDLDGDQVQEFVTCDDIFAYAYCPYASTPLATVVLAHDTGRGYVPAGPRFPEVYRSELERLTAQAEEAVPGGLGEWDSSTKCAVLPLVLALLYSGQDQAAWSELARLYPYADRETFRMQIEQTVGGSPLFAAG
jgi:hypothetical protein